MAKKITITGENLLDALTDAWGGQNNESSAVEVYGTTVPAGAEWGVNRGEVERFIKSVLTSLSTNKAGDFRWHQPQGENYYYLLLFATQEDAATWDADKSLTNYIARRQLPISTVATDTYVARLASDVSTTPSFAVLAADPAFNIHLRYQSVFIEGATSTQSNASIEGTITVERSINNGGTWATVRVLSGISSVDPTATEYPVALNLGDFLVSGYNNRLRLRASFRYTESGVTYTKYSTFLTYSISCVNLGVTMATDWSQPIQTTSSTASMALNFLLTGAVSKELHVTVDETLITYSGVYAASVDNVETGNITLTDATRQAFTHGIHVVKAWLTCSDGNGGTLTSDVQTYHLMMVRAGTVDTHPYLLLQEVSSPVNFVQSRICKYAIYGDSADVALIVSASAQSIITVPQAEYYRQERTIVPGVQYDLSATLEIEGGDDTIDAFLHVTRKSGGTDIDFLLECGYGSSSSGYQALTVDNSQGYAPTAGSTFYMNPKLRNNSEVNPARILNARNGNAVIESEWTGFKFDDSDGWITDADGNKMLHIPAGCLLNIRLNPFAQFLANPASSMTMEFDMKVSNITNEEDPIIRLCETVGSGRLGLYMMSLVGMITTASHTIAHADSSDFRWAEDERVHISINICNAVRPNVALNGVYDGLETNASPSTGTLPLVRVFINGVIIREFTFDNTSSVEFCTALLSNGGFFIGQEGADVSIYGIRIWAMQQLSAQNVVQNWISTIPDAPTKRRKRAENDIMTSGRVDLDKVKDIGRNYLIWHGTELYHGAQSTQRGWWEFGQFDADGNQLPELSGTICKETASLPSKGQGTTAKTYYYWNIQTKLSDVTATIVVPLTDLHESITVEDDPEYEWMDGSTPTGEVGAWKLKGGNLGKGFPLASESFVRYHKSTVDGAQAVVVPDGWIDGNGKYRGIGYSVADGLPLAQKLVLKINYASSMQSHIIGVNRLYNDLHKAYCGPNALQVATPGAVVAKHLEPFLFFTQADASAAPIYRGPGAWGPGKMDKPTWGYVKSEYPNFCMIEGADNNMELTDMRVPFDDTVHGNDTYPKVFYNPEQEAWYYRTEATLSNAQKSIDFDGGKTVEYGGTSREPLDDTHLYAGEYPHATIVSYIRDAWNFLFLHNPRIKPYMNASTGSLGSFAEFAASESARDFGNKYWCSDYKLYRYDFSDAAWVPAGLWNGTSYDEVKLLDSTAASGTLAAATYNAYQALDNNDRSDYAGKVNDAFIAAIAAHAKANIGRYFIIDSLKFHYSFDNHFIAGTDNNSKNTYFVLVPVVENGVTVWKFELHQDDVDTVLATDNSGLQTKPYYIDRMHPYADDDVNHTDCLYEGANNVLFNLCEAMWEDSLELADTLRSVLTSMASLTGGIGSPESASMTGCWRALNRYILDVQRYIPAMAFNEAARIRYEFPRLLGYTSDQRQVDPIEQSMGDQLQSETQWLRRRLVYMASYAAFGEFAPGSTAGTGLSDLSQSFAMVMAALPNSTTETSVYHFRLVPHQWLYPTAAQAQSGINPHVRVAPGAANMPNGYYELTISPTGRSDDGITVYAINYYRSIGNIGDNCFNPSGTLTLNGKRMTSFTAEPTLYYSTTIGGDVITAAQWAELTDEQKAGYLPAFRCAGVTVGSATRIGALSMNGCSSVGAGVLNLTSLSRAKSIDLRGTDLSSVVVPQTSTLETLRLPKSVAALSLTGQPSLATLTIEGYGTLTQLTVTGSPLLGTSLRGHVLGMRAAGTTVTLLNLAGLNWMSQPVEADVIRWLIGIEDCRLKGRIAVVNGAQGILNYSDVAALIIRYGNIRDEENDLYISFPGTPISDAAMSIEGKKYINTDISSATYDLDPDKNFDGLGLLVVSGNDVGVATRSDGTTAPNVVWELTDDTSGVYAEFEDPYSPVLHFIQTGAAVRGVTLNVRATLTNTSGETHVVTKKIGLWNRIPEVGDYAWIDGQFDNQNDASKQLAGMVIRREEVRDDDDNITAYKLTVLSSANLAWTDVSPTGGYEGSWGIHPGASQGFSQDTTNGVYNDAVMEAVRLATNNNDVFDTPLPNLDGTNYIRKDADAVAAAGGGIAMQDATNVANDGYGTYSQAWMNNLDSESENTTLLAYADQVFRAARSELGITQQDYATIQASGGCNSEGIPLTTQGMYQIAELLVQKATDAGASNPARYRELLFPAVRRCKVWCPADIANTSVVESDLHESYTRGHWMLPSSGLLARIYNFMANSHGAYNGSAAPAQQYAEQSEGGEAPNVSLEAQKPLFANAIARGRSIPISYSSSYWSCTENNRSTGRYVNFVNGGAYYNTKYNSGTVRAVSAFTFVP